MNQIGIFQVGIEGLENKIWRKISILESSSVGDLAYTILATFDSLAYHLYHMKYQGNRYDCMIASKDYLGKEKLIDATITKLEDLKLKPKDKIEMTYDYGSPTTFIIQYLGQEAVDTKREYPRIIEGSGHGMLDDMTSDELLDVVLETDRLQKATTNYTPGYEKEEKYDYRNYDIDSDNRSLLEKVEKIKNGYEEESWALSDCLNYEEYK